MISGSKIYGRKDKIHTWGYCDSCGKYLKQMSYRGRKWTHINFIPIFPEGPHMYVIKECKKCNVGLHLPIENLQELVGNIENNAETAMLALHDGEEYFIEKNENGEDVKQLCVDTLLSAIEMLHCTGSDEAVHELLTALDKENYRKIYCAVKGKLLELQGDMKDAIVLYERAVKNFPDDENAYWLLAASLYNSEKIRESREVYESLLNTSSERTEVMLLLLEVYKELKDYVHMVDTFEACFEAHPEFAKQKKFVKKYKKACNKGGVNPKKALINID